MRRPRVQKVKKYRKVLDSDSFEKSPPPRVLRERKEHQKYQREGEKERYEKSFSRPRYENLNPYKMSRKPRFSRYE